MRLLELPSGDAPREEDIKFLESPIVIIRDVISDFILKDWGEVPVAGFRYPEISPNECKESRAKPNCTALTVSDVGCRKRVQGFQVN